MKTSGEYKLKGQIIDNDNKTHKFKLNVIATKNKTTPAPDTNKKEEKNWNIFLVKTGRI